MLWLSILFITKVYLSAETIPNNNIVDRVCEEEGNKNALKYEYTKRNCPSIMYMYTNVHVYGAFKMPGFRKWGKVLSRCKNHVRMVSAVI